MKIDPVELGARAMAWRYWQWCPRMVAIPSKDSDYDGWCTILDVRSGGTVCAWTNADKEILTDSDGAFEEYAHLVPDFTDAATVGAFYAHWRERVRSGKFYVSPDEERNVTWTFQVFGIGIELAETLVDLMENE